MSQKLNENIKLDTIIAPELISSQYGADINDKFQNINDNFAKLSNIDLYKGDTGNSVVIENIQLSKSINIFNKAGYDLYLALEYALSSKYGSANLNKKVPQGNLLFSPGATWDGDINKYKVAIMKFVNGVQSDSDLPGGGIEIPGGGFDPIIPMSEESTPDSSSTYLGSAIPMLFFDYRFSNDIISYNSNDLSVYEDINDCTCIVLFKYEDNKWVCEINESFPKLSYRNGNFYWVIGGENSSIRATGVKGDRGPGATIWMCKGEPGVGQDEVIVSQYMITENGKIIEKNFKNENNDAGYDGVTGDPVFVFDYVKNDYKGIVIANLATYDTANNQWTAKICGDLKHINFEENTVEFFKRLGKTTNNPTPARGMFLKFKPDDESNHECHAIYNKPNGTSNNLVISPQDNCNDKWDNPSKSNDTNLQIYYATQINGALTVEDNNISSIKHTHSGGHEVISVGNSGTDNIHIAVYDEVPKIISGVIAQGNEIHVRASDITNDPGAINIIEYNSNNDGARSSIILKNGEIKYTGDTHTITGPTTLSGALNVSEATTLSGTLNVSGATDLTSTLKVGEATTLSGTLNVSGETSLDKKLFIKNGKDFDTDKDKIVDENAIKIGLSSPIANNLYINRTGIQGYSEETGVSQIYLNHLGGIVNIGAGGLVVAGATELKKGLTISTGGLDVSGSITSTSTGTVTVGDSLEITTGDLIVSNGDLNADKSVNIKDNISFLPGSNGNEHQMIVNGNPIGNIKTGTTDSKLTVWASKIHLAGNKDNSSNEITLGNGGMNTSGSSNVIINGDLCINSAGNSKGDLTISKGNLTVTKGDLTVSGTTTLNDLTVSGTTTLNDLTISKDLTIFKNIFAASSVLFLNNTNDWTNGVVTVIDGRTGQFVIPKKPAYMLQLKPTDESSYIVGIPSDIYPPNCIVMMRFYTNTYYLHNLDNLDGFNNEFRMFVFGDEVFVQTVNGVEYKLRKPIGWINCGFGWTDNTTN